MKSDINLISFNQTELVKEGRMARILRSLAIISIFIVGISSLVLFLIIQSISPSGIRKQENVIEENMSSLHTKEAKIIIVSRKIKDIKNITSKRPKYDNLITGITDIIPENVSTNSLDINDNKIKLMVTSGSLLSLNKFLDNLFDMVKNGKIIGNLTIDGISVNGSSGIYTMSVSGTRI